MKITPKNISSTIDKLEDITQEYDNMSWFPNIAEEVQDIVYKMEKFEMPRYYDLLSFLRSAVLISISKQQRITDSVSELIMSIQSGSLEKTSLQIYFDDIKRTYDRENNNYNIQYCDDNRERLISMNLKTVISIAKKYQRLGVPLEDLISVGNYGLVVAWDKFDPNRAKYKTELKTKVKETTWPKTKDELFAFMNPLFVYGEYESLFAKKFNKATEVTFKEVLAWINSNINDIKFSSVASMWIRAYILAEIDKHSRTVRKPKSEIYKNKTEEGAYQIEHNISLDVNEPTVDMIDETEETSDDAQELFVDTISKLFEGMDPKIRVIVLRKMGIGIPRPMTPAEIANLEGISTARVSQLFQQGIKHLRNNAEKMEMTYNDLISILHN